MPDSKESVVYSLNTIDLQKVAKRFLNRRLTDKEVDLVGESVGDYIDWTQAIESAIQQHIRQPSSS